MKVAADADRLRREGVDVVDFGAGEPDFPTPDNIKQAAIRAHRAELHQVHAGRRHAGTEAGHLRAPQRRTSAPSYTPAECVVTVGGKHVIFNLMQVLLNPGDEVIIPVPYWVTYKDVVNYAGGKCVFVETDEANGFTLTAAHDRARTSRRRRKLVIINSPSNPSGAVLDREEFEKIFQLTSKRGIWLMTDECYCRFLYDSEPFSIASLAGREGHRDRRRLALEDLRDDRLAHRLRPGARAGDRRHHQAAEPLDVEPDVDRAEGRRRGAARAAGLGRA